MRGFRRHQAGALLGVQLRCFGLVMNCMLTMAMSKVRVVRCLLVFLGLVIFRCLLMMESRLLMMTSRAMEVLRSF